MAKKKVILIAVVGIVVVFSAFQVLKPKESAFNSETVTKGTVLQEVSESGAVEKGEDINLNFKTGGKIERVYVKVGDFVSAGQQLAKLDTAQLAIQLNQAEIAAAAQEARLLELQRSANADLDNYYDGTPAVLNQSYNLADSAIRQQVANLFSFRFEFVNPHYDLTFKNCNPLATQEATVLRKTVEDNLNNWRQELANLSNDPAVLENAILKAENYLNSCRNLLLKLSDTLNITCQLSFEEKTLIESYKPIVNLALTNLNTAVSSVSAHKNAIAAQKLAVQNYSLQDRQEITYQEGLVQQAKAGADLLKGQINDASLRAPAKGQIASVNKRTGESILVTEPLFVLLPDSPFQIKIDIYEEDIVKIKVGNPVVIELTAFPDKIFEGHVISTDPASKLIDGVVYYGVKIDFQNPPDGVRSGMSADITIRTAQKENVLAVSGSAIENRDGRYFVQVLQDGATTSEREITIGLKGENNLIEVTSGLQEGEQIAVPK